MSESLAITILGFICTLLSGVISFTLGLRAERKKQTLMIKAEMLKPINEWLKGAEKILSIFSDTLSSIVQNMPLPMNYDFDERKKAYNFMAEKTNEVLGIVASESLRTRKSKKLANELTEVILTLDRVIKFEILPKESEIVDRSNRGALSTNFVRDAGQLKLQVDSLLQRAYSLEAQIKTSLT